MKKHVYYKLLASRVEQVNILVTGAGGFIGHHLVERLSQNRANHVYALGRESSDLSYIDELPTSVQARISVVRCDLADQKQVMDMGISPAVIIHTAAKVSDYGRIPDFYSDNVDATRNLLEFSHAIAAQPQFIHFSTIDVYGYQDRVEIGEDTPIALGHNPYNTTKAIAEDIVRSYGHSLPATVLRPATVIGRYNKALILEIINMLKSKIMFYFRSGNRLAGLLDVRNLCDLVQDIINRPAAFAGQTVNIVDNWPVTWDQFIEDIAQETGYKKFLRIKLPYRISYYLGWFFEKVYSLLRIKSRPPITRLGVQLLGTHQQVSNTRLMGIGYSPAYDYAASINDIGLWLEQLEKE